MLSIGQNNNLSFTGKLNFIFSPKKKEKLLTFLLSNDGVDTLEVFARTAKMVSDELPQGDVVTIRIKKN